jgi:hypothetical protein
MGVDKHGKPIILQTENIRNFFFNILNGKIEIQDIDGKFDISKITGKFN